MQFGRNIARSLEIADRSARPEEEARAEARPKTQQKAQKDPSSMGKPEKLMAQDVKKKGEPNFKGRGSHGGITKGAAKITMNTKSPKAQTSAAEAGKGQRMKENLNLSKNSTIDMKSQGQNAEEQGALEQQEGSPLAKKSCAYSTPPEH